MKERQKLSFEDKFKFSCHKGLSCFGTCCGDVNIFLTPYDVLRMKKALNLSSREFLERYTITCFLDNLPSALLKMREDERRSCLFVTPEGCMIYEDRPWSCRMYPLGIFSSQTEVGGSEEFYFIPEEAFSCPGFKEDKEWTVAEWKKDQGIDLYEKKSQPYKEMNLHRRFQEGKKLSGKESWIFYLACYNIDRFRELLFEGRFFRLFDVDKELMEKIKMDDEELLSFGFKWLRFSLFGESTLRIKDKVLEKYS